MAFEQLTLAKSAEESLCILAQVKQPDCALLYACIYAKGGSMTVEEAGKVLEWDAARLAQAVKMLAVFDLVRDGVKPPVRGESLADPGELLICRREDGAFAGICDYFEQCKGRQMTQREMSILLEVYQSLNMPASVLGLLIGWCQESGHFSIQNIQRQAYQWHNKGILSFEQATAHLDALRRWYAYESGVLRMLGQTNREATESQKKFIDQWRAWGVNRELLAMAYDKTMMGTGGKFSWSYIHKILESWHNQGIKNRNDVEQKDRRPANPVAAAAPQPESAERRILRQLEQTRLQRERTLQQRLETLRGISPEFRDNESALRLCASRMARCGSGDDRAKLEQQKMLLLDRQKGILVRLGHPADWLSDQPNCPHCGDRGYIGSKRCTCLEAMLQKETCAME